MILLIVGYATLEPPAGASLRGRALKAALDAETDTRYFQVWQERDRFGCAEQCGQCSRVTLEGIGPDPFGDQFCAQAVAALRERVTRERPEAVVVSDIRLYHYLAEAMACGVDRVAVDMHNAEGDMYELLADHPVVISDEARRRAPGVRAVERYVTEVATTVSVVCDDDAVSIRDRYGADPVWMIPNAVDLTGRTAPSDVRPPGRIPLLFTGVLEWVTNELAALTLARDIFPAVLAEVPEATLTIAGMNPTPELAALAGPRTTILANPPDVGPLFPDAIMVTPFHTGGGNRFKVLQAFAAGASVVSTPEGVSGIDVVAGTHYLAATTPAEFAAQIRHIAENPDLDLKRRRTAFELVHGR